MKRQRAQRFSEKSRFRRLERGFPRAKSGGFTIIEVMVAIFIFSLVLTAIYSIWIGIMRGTEAVKTATASVQRSRVAIRTIETAFVTSEMFMGNILQYAFVADTSGDMAVVSMVSRLPPTFPGARRYGDIPVQRVTFSVQAGKSGGNELQMHLMPLLLDTNSGHEAYTLTLARDVTLFSLHFYDAQNNEWLDEWKYTNQMPKLVQVDLGLGSRKGHSSDPQDVVSRLISLPSTAVGGDIQGAGPPLNQGTNRVPGQPPIPNPSYPGQSPGQVFPGGSGYNPGVQPQPQPGSRFGR